MFNNFFEQTFANTNQVVTATSDDVVQLEETIDGTSDCATYSSSGTTTYSFIQDGEYIYAMASEYSNYYTVSEEYYNSGYFAYKRYIDVFELLSEEDGLTCSCVVTGSSKDGESTSTMILEVDSGDDGRLKQPRRTILSRASRFPTLPINGEPVVFPRSKAKELLAYLVDRQGACVTRPTIFTVLWEDGGVYDRSK